MNKAVCVKLLEDLERQFNEQFQDAHKRYLFGLDLPADTEHWTDVAATLPGPLYARVQCAMRIADNTSNFFQTLAVTYDPAKRRFKVTEASHRNIMQYTPDYVTPRKFELRLGSKLARYMAGRVITPDTPAYNVLMLALYNSTPAPNAEANDTRQMTLTSNPEPKEPNPELRVRLEPHGALDAAVLERVLAKVKAVVDAELGDHPTIEASTYVNDCRRKADYVPCLAVLKSANAEGEDPIYLVIREHYYDGKRSYEDNLESRKYWYDVHTCVGNWLNTVQVISGGRLDEHGIFQLHTLITDEMFRAANGVGIDQALAKTTNEFDTRWYAALLPDLFYQKR